MQRRRGGAALAAAQPSERSLPGIAPEQQHAGECQRRSQPQRRVRQSGDHLTGTFSVTVYSSNSDTRSVTLTDQVPAGERIASGTV